MFDELFVFKEFMEKFLNSENTEGVSDALDKSSVSNDVREMNASRTPENVEASVEDRLGKITDTESDFYCFDYAYGRQSKQCIKFCGKCECIKITKGS